ncbi:hypothetical protein AWB75_05203 [Caballeronia catudaia]|uniref:Lipoprotein n=1 Tax=Caballeronia catudaia TaxID=1777136 RepID=A0A158CIN0_9BURK|nr:hypothetical protein [Caballeronia catudaia]SAK82140.1 hypothetical protein AWB75_05203 [Caballeronia catudaia]
MKTVLISALLVAGFSLGSLTQAQEPTDTLQSMPPSAQQNAQSIAPSGDSAYGGAPAGQSASGTTSKWTTAGGTSRCTPLPFCNVYSGGQ